MDITGGEYVCGEEASSKLTENVVQGAAAELARRVLEFTVATALEVPSNALRARTRRAASIAFARQDAMYLAHVGYGLSLTESGALFGRDRTTAAHACCVVEDRRDDTTFDIFMDRLENAVLRLRDAVRKTSPSQ
jgi:chromosomal replication initiation ATPase DnaA